MTHSLTLTFGGSTIDFSSGSCTLMEYIPQSPDITTVDTNSILVDGGERTQVSRRNVTESARFLVRSTCPSLVTEFKQKIQSWFIFAEHRQRTGTGCPVFVNFQPSGTASLFQSEIFSGKVELGFESLDWRWDQSKVEMTMGWTRRYFWEGEITSVCLLSDIDSSFSSSQIVNNVFDEISGSIRRNYVTIPATCIHTEIPTPAMINITNRSGSTIRPRRLYLFHGLSDPISSPSSLLRREGEDAIGGTSTSTTSSCASENVYKTFTIPASISQSQIATWSVVLHAGYLRGGYAAAVIRTVTGVSGSTSGSVYLQGKLTGYSIGAGSPTYVQEGAEFEFDTSRKIHELGIFKVPHLGIYEDELSVTQWEGTKFEIDSRSALSTSTPLAIDYIHFYPTVGYRKILINDGFISGSTTYIMLDEPNGRAYIETPNANGDVSFRYPARVVGKSIFMYPHHKNFLFVALEEESEMRVDRTFAVSVSYRPRRLTI